MSSKNYKHEIDRRALLKNILVGTGLCSSGAFNTFLTSMMVGFAQKANAQAAGDDPAFEEMKFISLVMAGGLPRYYWDLPMKPSDSDTLIANPMVATRFNKSGSQITTEYATTKINGYNMPWIWSGQMPTIGGTVAMKELAQHMLIMRGIDLQIDSHEIDRFRQVAPVPGGISLSGLVADHSNTPIPAIGRNGGGSYYQGEKGIAYLEMGGTNPLSAALAPFSPMSSMLSMNNAQVESAIDAALIRMQKNSQDKNKFLPSTFSSRFNAKKLMLRKFGDLQSQYTTLLNKYRSLITRSFSPTDALKLAGVEDLIVSGTRDGRQRFLENEYYSGASIQSLTDNQTFIAELAEGMAIAEYMVINGLSSSVNIQSGNFANLICDEAFNKVTQKIARTNSRMAYSTDVHFTGTEIGVVLFTRYYRAISACLYELMARLKETKVASGGNLFDKTVMTVTSDFNRLPRLDASGADHGWQGSNFTVISGAIDELQVVGNVKTTDVNKRGTWGIAGGLTELGGREAIIGNAASTVANILDIKTPTPNDMSFTTKEKGKVKLAIKSTKNIAA